MSKAARPGPGVQRLETAELPRLFDRLDVGVIVQGRDATILYANATALELLGLGREQVLGQSSFDPSWDVVRPDGTRFPADERPATRVLRTGEPQRDVVLGVRQGEGGRRWLLANAMPHRGDEETIDYVVVTLSDASSERRRMALLEQVRDELEDAVHQRTTALRSSVEHLEQVSEALARSRAQFERVTRAVPGVLYRALVEADGAVTLEFVSAPLRELCGIEPADAMVDPQRLLEAVHPAGRVKALASLEQARASGGIWECEVRVRAADGRWRWVRNRAVGETTPDGTIWSGLVLDVTAQRSLAEQVRMSQARQAIGSVTAGIAHNFNNVLAALMPNLEECLVMASEPQRRPLLDSIEAATSAAELVRQLMVIVRGESVDTRDKKPVVLDALVQDVLALCRRIFQGRITIEASIGVQGVRVRANPGSLRQTLLNVCINARDALRGIDGGHVAVSLVVHDRDGPEPRAVVSVRDDGCGMDEATLQRLGEPFFTTKPPGEGTGLGLATAIATVRGLGGELQCDSAPGVGTEVSITLPVLDFEGSTRAAPVVTVLPDRPRGRLLLIDDEPLIRAAVGKALSRRGFVVDVASDGIEGLACIDEAVEPYEVVLLDLSMPGMSGERVLERLQHSHPGLPVVIMSGFVEDPERVASAAAVLHKPLTTRGLVATLDEVLGLAGSRGESAGA